MQIVLSFWLLSKQITKFQVLKLVICTWNKERSPNTWNVNKPDRGILNTTKEQE